MNLNVERVDVWAAGIKDEPGGLAKVLAGLQDVGADLEFMIARRSPDEPGSGVVFVAPLRGDEEISEAAMLGFNITEGVTSVRVEGDNQPGIAATLVGKLAEARLNLRGLSAAVIGERFVMYIGLDNVEDATRAVEILGQA